MARPKWQGEHIALGTNTDPYQWVEGRYKLMRGIWAAMRDARNPCSVLTKSPLLLRDLDLMRELNACTDFSAPRCRCPRSTSGPGGPPSPARRIRGPGWRRWLSSPGPASRTGILVAPLMPGINDAPEQLEPILEAAAEAGAAYVTGIGLHLRRGVREVFMEWLAEERPDLVERYAALYGRGAYLAAGRAQAPGRPAERARSRRPRMRMRGRY